MALMRITVLISGRGSNMAALIDACIAGRIEGAVTHVISNRPDAAGFEIARGHGIATTVVDHRTFASRELFDGALADGAARHGCTVHFVTPDVDCGPIVAQAEVRVQPDDDPATLAARVLEQEHRLLPEVVGWFCAGRLRLEGGRVSLVD